MLLCADVKLEIQIANQHRCSSFQNSWNTCHSLLKYYETAATALKPIMIVEIEIVVLQHEIFLYLIQHFSGWVHINSHEPGTFSIHRYRSRLTQLVQPNTILHECCFFFLKRTSWVQFAGFGTCMIVNGHNASTFATKNKSNIRVIQVPLSYRYSEG